MRSVHSRCCSCLAGGSSPWAAMIVAAKCAGSRNVVNMRPCCWARTHSNFHKTLLSALGPNNNFNRAKKRAGGNHTPGFSRCAHCGGHCIRRCWLDRSLRAQRLKEKRPALPFVNFFRDAHCDGRRIGHYSLDGGIRGAGIETEKDRVAPTDFHASSHFQSSPLLHRVSDTSPWSFIFADSFQFAAVAQGPFKKSSFPHPESPTDPSRTFACPILSCFGDCNPFLSKSLPFPAPPFFDDCWISKPPGRIPMFSWWFAVVNKAKDKPCSVNAPWPSYRHASPRRPPEGFERQQSSNQGWGGY